MTSNTPSFVTMIATLSGFLAAACFADTNPAFDFEAPPGPNFAIAAFRWWHPPEAEKLLGVLVLVPGSNSDGRSQVEDPFWQDFAKQHSLALVGCYFKDGPHEDQNIEEYARAKDGTGKALLDAVDHFAEAAAHPEAATAPILLWGHSAGGEFNYEFACWKPERLAAFVVNKGGYYFTHLAPAATRAVPGIFFIGGKDAEFRIQSIQGIFALNHQAGAVWKLIIEPDTGHDLGKTRELATEFFAEVLSRPH